MTEAEYVRFVKEETDLEREAALYSQELEHHGVKGQSWGDRNGPPYPLSRGKDGRVTETQKKKKRSFLAKISAKKKKSKAASEKEKAKKKAAVEKKKEEKKEESLEEKKDKVLKSTDAKYIYKNRALLSDQELQDRINRITKENTLAKLASDDSAKKKVKEAEDWFKTFAGMAESSLKVYNAYNAISTSEAKKRAAAQEKARKSAEEAAKKKEVKKVKAEKEREEMLKKQYEEFDKRGSISSINPLSAMDAMRYASESYDTYSSIDVHFNPDTGELNFEKKKKR